MNYPVRIVQHANTTKNRKQDTFIDENCLEHLKKEENSFYNIYKDRYIHIFIMLFKVLFWMFIQTIHVISTSKHYLRIIFLQIMLLMKYNMND